MLIPLYFVKDAANRAFTLAAMNNPSHYKAFFGNDFFSFDEFSDVESSTWNGYAFACVRELSDNISAKDIIGFMRFPITRPDKGITGVKFALFDKSKRRLFYCDVMKCLKLIYDNEHPFMRFQTFEGTDAHNIYERLVAEGHLVKYEVPFSWVTALAKKEKWHHYAMDREMLGKFLMTKRICE